MQAQAQAYFVPVANFNGFQGQGLFPTTQTLSSTPIPATLPSIPGCVLWLDAADTTTVQLNGSTLSNWLDKSGCNNNATQLTTANQPTYANSAVTFTGSSNNLLTLTQPQILPVGNGTFFFVTNSPLPNTTQVFFMYGPSNMATPQNPQFYYYNGSANSYIIDPYGGSGTYDTTYIINSNAILSATFATAATTVITGYTNGKVFSQGAGTNSPIQSVIPQYASIGVTGQTTVTNYKFWYTGNIYEILIYNNTLSTTQRQQVEGYLAQKWSITRSFQTTHPYYNSLYFSPLVTNFSTTITNVTGTINQSFLPTFLSGLSLWLDAADRTTLFQNIAGTIIVTNGSQIQLWKDKSGGNNNASNSQSVILYSNAFNGSIFFPGTQTTGFSLNGSLLPNGSSDASYFFVINKPNSSLQVYFTHGSAATNLKQFYADSILYADKASVPLINDSVNITNQNIVVSFTETSLVGGVNGWRNGNAFTTNGATTTWNVGTTAAWLGSGGDTGTSFIYNGYISEVIIYSNALTNNQRQQVEGYLAWKWSLQGQLPSGHPNRYIPP